MKQRVMIGISQVSADRTRIPNVWVYETTCTHYRSGAACSDLAPNCRGLGYTEAYLPFIHLEQAELHW